MIHFKRHHNLLLFFICLITISIGAQEKNPLWKSSNLNDAVGSRQIDWNALPRAYQVYELNESKLSQSLGIDATTTAKSTSPIQVAFPNAYGEMEIFKVEERSMFAPELQAKFPEIKSFVGVSVENPSKKVRFSASNYGVNVVIFDQKHGSFYIDKIHNSKAYVAYQRKDGHTDKMICLVEEQVTIAAKNTTQARSTNADDGNLRTYRLAIAVTGEYSQYHLVDRGVNQNAPDSQKVEAVMDAINVAMTRVNGIFERDVALTMELVANNDQLIFLDAATDGLSNNDTAALIEESQDKIDDIIGNANYDIGHTFSTGAGGLAQLYSPCVPGSKASGVTGIAAPKGDGFYVDFVAHEMGHQFGANHTFNGTAGNCSGNESSASAVEPGSGTTIMGYAGICSPQNVQNSGDDYFHLVSIREMWAFTSQGNGNSCAQITATTNTAPVIEELENYTIPISTPFALAVNATDAENDILTYTWEQLDNEAAQVPLVSTETGGPAFRSVKPADSPTRYFPNLETTLAGNTSNQWEVLPSVERTMNFGVNVRDNNAEVGQTASDETFLTVSDTAGPFVVTSQSSAVNWDAGTTQTITWDVANTDMAPVSCEFVNILLSHDGGTTFSEVLASNVPNDGSHNIVAPEITTSEARIMVQSVGNVFFAVNAQEFSIQDSEFIMEFAATELEVCGPGSATYNFTFKTFLGFNENTTFSASGIPSGATVSFSPASASANDTAVEMTIDGLSESNIGAYEISVSGTSNSVTKNTLVNLDVFATTIAVPNLLTPSNGSSNIKKPYTLEWNSDINVQNYVLQVATDAGFTNIVDNAVISEEFYNPMNLVSNTMYFWRVKGQNICGESAYSEVFSFTSENEVCSQYVSNSTPLVIPDNNGAGVNATIEIAENILITDLNVGVSVNHSWVGDIRMVLTDPLGNSVVLVSNSDKSGSAYTNTIFDSEAEVPIGSGSPPFTGTFSPEGDLSSFNDSSSRGIWTLNISDNEAQDVGNLDSFFLQICGIPYSQNDDDGDGVLNDNDLCPNTPLGAEVDSNGCAIIGGDHFTVLAVGETCPDLDNGSIEITAKTTDDYTVDFSGQTFSFTSEFTIEGIAPGSYNLCISIDDENYEQCYSLTIEEGVEISAKSVLSEKTLELEIEEGTAPFKVFRNDEFLFETDETVFNVDVVHGDVISVTSKEACQGVYEKQVNLIDFVSLYPNPVRDYYNISIPSNENQVKVAVYSVSGQLIRSHVSEVKQHKIQLESTSLPQGVYFVKVELETPVVLKLIKH